MVMVEEKQEDKLVALQMLAKITEIPLSIKQFHSNWILLTYDIPNTKEGAKARSDFLNRAKYLGAMMHTESVYLLPHTDAANGAALSLAEAGDVYLWYTKAGSEAQAVSLTKNYDHRLAVEIAKIQDRVDKIAHHAREGHERQVVRMANNTWTMIDNLSKAVVNRGSAELAQQLCNIIAALKYAENAGERPL
jgi:hypothetical protein